MIYSPVIIPTLNRYEHFRECLESLEHCVDADKTTVYIGLDYPPSEKHVDGWKKIDNYLNWKESNNSFYKLVVIRRQENCGLNGENSNASLLYKHLKQIGYDRYIISEDDNVFSPNFLVYINKGLEKFKNNNRILCICGYTHPYQLKFKDNTFFFHNVYCSAWGQGRWVSKVEEYDQWKDPHYFRNSFSLKNLIKMFKVGRRKVVIYLRLCRNYNTVPMTDYNLGTYAVVNNMNVVCPTMSLVRNIGCDGTGLSFHEVNDEYTNAMRTQPISDAYDFKFIGNGFEYYNKNRKILRNGFIGNPSWKQVIKELLKYIIWRLNCKN